jgi:6,7-dimethyl-8-ribityllumazine synthase
MKIGIVVSEFYWDDITSEMLENALKVCVEREVATAVLKVPGCFDMAMPVKKLCQQTDIDGVVTLGAVIKGETDHDKVIMFALAKTLQELCLQYSKPIVLGVNGPGMTREQAIARIGRATEVTKVCIELIEKFD